MQAQLTRHDVVTAIPTRDPDTVRGDLRTQVYAHHEPPTTGPSYLDELKDREIDGTDSATRYDIATAGWEPEPRYTAFLGQHRHHSPSWILMPRGFWWRK